MAWHGAASRSFLAAVRGRTASSSSRLRSAPHPSDPHRRIPGFAPSSAPFATARPLAAMAAMAARLTGHSAASARAYCVLSQGTPFCRTCQDR